MKTKEIRDLSDAELDKKLAELRSQLQDLRFAAAGRRLSQVRDMRAAKKNIARILTVKKERELDASKVEAPVEKPAEAENKAAAKEQAPAEAKA